MRAFRLFRPSFGRRVVVHLQGKAVFGVVSLLPIIVPWVIVAYFVNMADSAVVPLLDGFLREVSRGRLHIPDFAGMGLVLGVTGFYIAGVLASSRPGQAALSFVTRVMETIPIVKGIHGLTHQASSVVTSQFNFSRVVFIEWPRPGLVALGFVTSMVDRAGRDEKLVLVYIPTVPNPTSGNLAMVAEDELFETDISVEDAMKLVFSGGLVPPDEMSLARVPVRYRSRGELSGRFKTRR